MSDKVLTVYHTTAKSNEKSILENGFLFSKGKRHWLGKGVYFYKDKYFAVQWGFIGVEKRDIEDINEYINCCSIISVDLDCEKNEVLDVNTPDGYKIFLTLKDIIREFFSDEECNKIFEKGDSYLIYTLEKLEKDFGIKTLSKFDIIFAEYENNIYKKKKNNKSDFNCCTERQICVKNLDAMSNISIVDLNNIEISDLFALVKENRGDLYD